MFRVECKCGKEVVIGEGREGVCRYCGREIVIVWPGDEKPGQGQIKYEIEVKGEDVA
jgi:hypothetical protein